MAAGGLLILDYEDWSLNHQDPILKSFHGEDDVSHMTIHEAIYIKALIFGSN